MHCVYETRKSHAARGEKDPFLQNRPIDFLTPPPTEFGIYVMIAILESPDVSFDPGPWVDRDW